MEHLQPDNLVVTFDISDILNENSTEKEELDTDDIPDEVLREIIISNQENVTSEAQNIMSNVVIEKSKGKQNANPNKFRKITNSDVDDIAINSSKKTTHKQTAWGVKVFKEWLLWKGLPTTFEDVLEEKLADTLGEFYPSARPTSKEEKGGKPYAKQSLINIRSAINRYLQLPPHNKAWDIMNDKEFLVANHVFKGNLCEQKEKGLDRSHRHPPVSKEHLDQIHPNYFIPHYDNDPVCLQYKVYFDIAFFGQMWSRRPEIVLL